MVIYLRIELDDIIRIIANACELVGAKPSGPLLGARLLVSVFDELELLLLQNEAIAVKLDHVVGVLRHVAQAPVEAEQVAVDV